jgi:hypothetical protein
MIKLEDFVQRRESFLAEKQEVWLQQNSPYRYHKCTARQFSHLDCCGEQPQPDGTQLLHYHPEEERLAWFSLYRCSRCGRYYIELHGKWKRIDNPLQFERKER